MCIVEEASPGRVWGPLQAEPKISGGFCKSLLSRPQDLWVGAWTTQQQLLIAPDPCI